MLVLKKIHGALNYFVFQSSIDNIEFYNKVKFSILDTDTNKIKLYNLKKVIDNYESIFGVFKETFETFPNEYRIVCIEVTDDLWNFLDIIKEPEATSIRPNMLIYDLYNGVTRDKNNSTKDINIYKTQDGTQIVVINIDRVKYFLDDTHIFWMSVFYEYHSILDCYKHIFNKVSISKDTVLYMVICNDKGFKLDINKGIIRYVTKQMTLRG